jgi:hypothetical protein
MNRFGTVFRNEAAADGVGSAVLGPYGQRKNERNSENFEN